MQLRGYRCSLETLPLHNSICNMNIKFRIEMNEIMPIYEFIEM